MKRKQISEWNGRPARRSVGQAVACAVMALVMAVGGLGTTALLATQPGLTVETTAVLNAEKPASSDQTNGQKKKPKSAKKPSAEQEVPASSVSVAEEETLPAAEPKVTAQPVESAAPVAAEPAETEQPAAADPMCGDESQIDQENHFPTLQQETEALAAEDPLSAPEEVADDEETTRTVGENSEESLSIETEEGTILLTPEEIRAALDAGTLDETALEGQLTDENGFLTWLWEWLFGKKNSSSSASTKTQYTGWRTVKGKTYYYSSTTHEPLTGIQSIDNKLYYFNEKGVQQDATFGIDVSKYQTSVDFEKVKEAGVEFVIIRIGYRGYGSGTLVLDPMFEEHYTNAQNAGLRIGVYFFSQATTEDEAREEAQACWYVLNGRHLDYAVYFDSEASGSSSGSGRADGLGKNDRTKCAVAFCEEIKALGYQPGVYASTKWFNDRLDLSKLKNYSLWNANYGVASSPISCDLWQGTCTARISGYGGQLDVNISYIG